MAKKKSGGRKKASKKSKGGKKKRTAKQKAAFKKMQAAAAKKRGGKKSGKKKSKKGSKKRKGGGKKKRTAKQKAATKRMQAAAAAKRKGKGGKKAAKKRGKKRSKKKASKKRAVAKRPAAKPARAKRARKAWPVGVPRPKYTVSQGVERLSRAGTKLARSGKVGRRKRAQTPGLSSAARRMQMASQGVLQVNPFDTVPGYPGIVVATPGKGDKVRKKAVGVRLGKRSTTKYGKGSVGSMSKKKETELDRIRRAAGIPARGKRTRLPSI